MRPNKIASFIARYFTDKTKDVTLLDLCNLAEIQTQPPLYSNIFFAYFSPGQREFQGYLTGNQSGVSQGRISGWFTVRNHVWAGSVKSSSSSTRLLELLLFLWNYFIPNSPSNPSIIKRSGERILNCSSYSFLSLNPVMCMFDISGWIQSFFGEVIIFWEFPNISISNKNETIVWKKCKSCNFLIVFHQETLNFEKSWGPPHDNFHENLTQTSRWFKVVLTPLRHTPRQWYHTTVFMRKCDGPRQHKAVERTAVRQG